MLVLSVLLKRLVVIFIVAHRPFVLAVAVVIASSGGVSSLSGQDAIDDPPQTSKTNPPSVDDSKAKIQVGPARQRVTGGDVSEASASLEDLPAVAVPLDGRDGRDLSVRLFRPKPQIRVPVNDLTHAKFSVVDVHTHFYFRVRDNLSELQDFVRVMDRNRIAVCVSLDGRLGGRLQRHHAFLNQHYPDRFVVFANIDWQGDGESDRPETWACHRPGFADRVADQLTEAVQRGWASGLKLFKRFGLGYRNPDGSFIEIDDSRFDPIWKRCGELGLPILMHTADPAAFFEPIGPENERWEELQRHPDWSFADEKFPRRDTLHAARNRMIAKHPGTNFIAAHVANQAEDLSIVADWLDRYPNMHVEIASRISELGRQDRIARDFLIRYQDRVLFGTDGPWPEKRLRLYWRFLETFDENFDYSEKVPPPQGLWRIDGVGLPDEVLRKVYHENAARIIPGIGQRWRLFRGDMTRGDEIHD